MATERRPRYSIIIPAYDESARLGSTLEKVLAFVSEREMGGRGHCSRRRLTR